MCADIIGKKSDLIISKDLNPGIEAVHIYMEPEEIGHMCCRIEPEICFVYPYPYGTGDRSGITETLCGSGAGMCRISISVSDFG